MKQVSFIVNHQLKITEIFNQAFLQKKFVKSTIRGYFLSNRTFPSNQYFLSNRNFPWNQNFLCNRNFPWNRNFCQMTLFYETLVKVNICGKMLLKCWFHELFSHENEFLVFPNFFKMFSEIEILSNKNFPSNHKYLTKISWK